MVVARYRKIMEAGLMPLPFALALLWVCGWAATHFWPASFWLEVDRVVAANGDRHSPVLMIVDREIKRPFSADWRVVVRSVEATGTTVHCVATGESDYRPDAVLPDPLTLGWWAWGGECEPLPAGQYIISTRWEIHPGFMPMKVVQADSNVFSIGRGQGG